MGNNIWLWLLNELFVSTEVWGFLGFLLLFIKYDLHNLSCLQFLLWITVQSSCFSIILKPCMTSKLKSSINIAIIVYTRAGIIAKAWPCTLIYWMFVFFQYLHVWVMNIDVRVKLKWTVSLHTSYRFHGSNSGCHPFSISLVITPVPLIYFLIWVLVNYIIMSQEF